MKRLNRTSPVQKPDMSTVADLWKCFITCTMFHTFSHRVKLQLTQLDHGRSKVTVLKGLQTGEAPVLGIGVLLKDPDNRLAFSIFAESAAVRPGFHSGCCEAGAAAVW